VVGAQALPLNAARLPRRAGQMNRKALEAGFEAVLLVQRSAVGMSQRLPCTDRRTAQSLLSTELFS